MGSSRICAWLAAPTSSLPQRRTPSGNGILSRTLKAAKPLKPRPRSPSTSPFQPTEIRILGRESLASRICELTPETARQRIQSVEQCPKITSASNLFRDRGARAALPQNCSPAKLNLSHDLANGTLVLLVCR